MPQFSIRWLLAATAMCAVVFSIVALAARGHGWAIGVSVALGALAVALAIFGVLSAVVGLFGLIVPAGSGRTGASPFGPRDAAGAPAAGAADNSGHSHPAAGAADAAPTPPVQPEVVKPD